jgi:hypothetical protein
MPGKNDLELLKEMGNAESRLVMPLAEVRHGHSLTVVAQKRELILRTLLSRVSKRLLTKFGCRRRR